MRQINYTCQCGHIEASAAEIEARNAIFSEIEQGFNRLAAWVFSPKGKNPAGALYQMLYSRLYNGVIDGFSKKRQITQMTYDRPDPRFLTMYRLNIARFSAAKTVAAAKQFNQLKNKHLYFDDFKKAVDKLGLQYNGQHLQTEYEFAVAAGQMGGLWLDLQDTKAIFPYVKYRTVGDSRVRPPHAAIDGLFFLIGSPELDTIYPPNGWKCRCDLERATEAEAQRGRIMSKQDLTQLLQSMPGGRAGESEYDYMRRNRFHVNRGRLETIFLENEMYISRFNEKTLLNDFYGADDLAAIKYLSLPEIVQTSRAYERNLAIFNRFAASSPRGGDVWTQNTVFGLPVLFHLWDFKQVAQSPAGPYLDYLTDAVSHPAEVWAVKTKDGYLQRYIKFYREGGRFVALVVESQIQAGQDEKIVNVHLVPESQINDFRRGLLQM
jgi:SPP1 gp7 family putative phage head morphogenesis protein